MLNVVLRMIEHLSNMYINNMRVVGKIYKMQNTKRTESKKNENARSCCCLVLWLLANIIVLFWLVERSFRSMIKNLFLIKLFFLFLPIPTCFSFFQCLLSVQFLESSSFNFFCLKSKERKQNISLIFHFISFPFFSWLQQWIFNNKKFVAFKFFLSKILTTRKSIAELYRYI